MLYFRKIVHILLFSLFVCGIHSCKNNNNKLLVRHFPESVYDSAINLRHGGAFHFIDSVYATQPVISIADKYRYYRVKAAVYDPGYANSNDVEKFAVNAIVYIDSSITLIEDNNLADVMADDYIASLSDKANYLLHLKEFDRATEILSKCRLFCKGKGNICGMADITASAGSVYYQQRRYLESLDLYKEALQELTACDKTSLDFFLKKQGWLDNAGLGYLRAGVPDSAIIYFEKALQFIDNGKGVCANTDNPNFPEVAKAVVFSNIAQAYTAKKKYPEAEQYFISSIKAIYDNNRKGYLQESNRETLIQLAALYTQTNRLSDAYTLLKQAEQLLPGGDDNTRLRWLKGMASYFEAAGNVQQANAYLTHFLQLRDSATITSHELLSTNLADAFESDEKAFQLKVLEKNGKINLFYIRTSAAFVLIILGLSSLFYYNWKRSGFAVRKLTILNRKVKQRGEQLDRLVADLKQQNDQKERIMRIIAHDLRTPVSNIMVSASLLAEGELLKEEEFLKLTKIACADSLRLVNEILTMSENDENVVLEKKNFELNTLVSDAVALMRISATDKKQQIIFSPSGTNADIYAGPEMLRRVINNLVGNAIKFSNDRKKIKVDVFDEPGFYKIAIEDEGIGIDLKNQPAVFDSFSELRRPGTKGEKSFGLGLSICKKIIEAHGGRLYLKSEAGKGTIFFIELKK